MYIDMYMGSNFIIFRFSIFMPLSSVCYVAKLLTQILTLYINEDRAYSRKV